MGKRRRSRKTNKKAKISPVKKPSPTTRNQSDSRVTNDVTGAAVAVPEDLAHYTDDDLRQLLLKHIHDEAQRNQYCQNLSNMAFEFLDDGDRAKYKRLLMWSQRFRIGSLDHDCFRPAKKVLGAGTKSFGYGLNAKSHADELQNYIQEIQPSSDDDYKGLTLAHFYYRRFLKHIYGTFAIADRNHSTATGQTSGQVLDKSTQLYEEENSTPSTFDDEEDPSLRTFIRNAHQEEEFQQAYSLIFKDNREDVLSQNTQEQLAHEACVTSLLAAYINQVINTALAGVGVKDHKRVPVWCSEYTLFKSGKDKTTTTEEGQTRHNNGARCDGLLCMPDPIYDHSLRPLVMMEVKLTTFDHGDDLHSISNACDAIAQCSNKNDSPWPLLVFRWVLTKYSCRVQVLSMVPIQTPPSTKFKLVPLWTESDFTNSLYKSVMAAVFAAIEFQTELINCKKQLLFCRVKRNIAFQEYGVESKPRFVYKSFIKSEIAKDNVAMVKQFVDPEVKKVQLNDMGCWLKMRYLGEVLNPNTLECDVNKFVEIGTTLALAHSMDICHGDVRMHNFILEGEKGIIIDWDLAGPEESTTYPEFLYQIPDGKRHPEVSEAIKNRTVGTLHLSKAHDWYSLRAVMELFEPTNKANLVAWKYLIENIDKSSEHGAARQDFRLVQKDY